MLKLLIPQDKIILRQVFNFARRKNVKLYIVGGYLRDIFLKRKKENPDIDFCILNGAIAFGRKLSKELKAGFVVLDQEHGCCRIVKKTGAMVYTLDFADFRGHDLADDLLHRDFTINSLVLELDKLFVPPAKDLSGLISDHYHAASDIASKRICVINKNTFDEDPLRILRAFSLSAIFGFAIDKDTIKLIKSKRSLLAGVSAERIRDELFKILDCPNAFEYLLMLDKFKILGMIFPEIEIMRGVSQGPYHHLDVLKHSFETVRQLELVFSQIKSDRRINDYLDEFIAGQRRRRALLKIAALLHDLGKPKAKRRKAGKTMFHGHEGFGARLSVDIARRLKLSNDEIDALRKIIFWHLRPGYLADNQTITPRAKFRYFRDAALEGVSILLLSIADQRSTRGVLTSKGERVHHEKVMRCLINEYFRMKNAPKFTRLINGNDLIKQLKLAPSPLLGEILSEIEELQAIGRIKTKKEALAAAKRFIKK